MKNIYVIVAALVLFTPMRLYSQDTIPKFGKVEYSDLTRTYDLKDKEAPACVVHEEGRYYFANGRFFRDVYIRIHILKQAGIEYADFEIPFFSSAAHIDRLTVEGCTYNPGPNNMVIRTPLDKINILDEKVDENIFIRKIVMPDAREGSLIELHYNQGSYYFVMPPWEFQKDIPVLYSQLRYDEASAQNYAMIFRREEDFDVHSINGKDVAAGAKSSKRFFDTFTYAMRDIDALEEVDFLRNAVDYRPGIHPQKVTVFPSPSELRENLSDHASFGKYIKSSVKEAGKLMAASGLDNYDDAGKIKAIVRYVRNNYTWDGTGGKYAYDKLSGFLKKKTGNAGNLNLFLIGMLQAAGIEAYPVILRKMSDGQINKDYPFIDFFNFVVVQATAGGKTYYLDATDTCTPFDMVSRECINTEGLVLKSETEEWVVITNPHPSVSFADMTLTIDPVSGIISGDVVESYSGLDAVRERQWYGGDRERLEAMFKDKDFILTEVSAENYNNVELPFKITYGFEAEMTGTGADKIFIEPLAHLAPKDNIFKETQRKFPIDLVARSMSSYKVSIAIPEGYDVEYLPESKTIDTREISMIFSADADGNTVHINAMFSFKYAVYRPSDYDMLKKYYGDMINLFSGNIILRKN